MKRYKSFPAGLILLFVTISAFATSCSATPTMTEAAPPTPTPLPGGSIFFDPIRVSAETKAIEVKIINLSGRVPQVETAIIITKPTVLREITTTLLSAVSTGSLKFATSATE